ncbi:MAG: hypothetical protein LBR37_02620 [Erysipelotrichaceae bacterium]|jgi:hypothetical protein|nr:hypothetical protein [Erysipelotrichaceae bacterium]
MKYRKIAGLFLLGTIALVSCKEDVTEAFSKNQFNSPNFIENYYTAHEASFVDNLSKREAVVLDETKRFEKYHNDPNFAEVDRHYDRDVTNDDSSYDYFFKSASENSKLLGDERKMTKYERSFERYYVSKLYDGKLFCHGEFQKVRVQIDEAGFSHRFGAELEVSSGADSRLMILDDEGILTPNPLFDSEYFAVSFKGASNHNETRTTSPRQANIDFNLSLFFKSNDEYQQYDELKITFKSVDISLNAGDNEAGYSFLGCYFNQETIASTLPFTNRMVGLGITYHYNSIEGYSLDNLEENAYALFLYEIFLPTKTWY